MFLEKLREGRDGDVESVRSVVLLELLELCGAGNALGLLERRNGGFRLNVDGISKSRERLGLWVVEESALLEKK